MTTGAPIGPKGVPTGDISDLGFRQDEGRIVFTTSPSTSRTDVFIADVDDLVEAVAVHFQGEGGVTIPANLYRPKNTSFDAAASVIEYRFGAAEADSGWPSCTGRCRWKWAAPGGLAGAGAGPESRKPHGWRPWGLVSIRASRPGVR